MSFSILNVIFIVSPETALGTAVMLLIFWHLCICASQSRSCVYISNLPADEETRCPVCLNQANEAADSSFSKEGRRAEYQKSSAVADEEGDEEEALEEGGGVGRGVGDHGGLAQLEDVEQSEVEDDKAPEESDDDDDEGGAEHGEPADGLRVDNVPDAP